MLTRPACNDSGMSGNNHDVEREAHFEMLYRRNAPLVMAYLLRRAQRTVAEDVFSEVFAVCWRRCDEVPAEPLPWLLGVARRALATNRRGEQRRAALHVRLTETAPEAAEAASLREGALIPALESLTETDRELLLLIAWDGLTPAQAATVLAVKPGTVRVRLARARRRLHNALERPPAADSPAASSLAAMESTR